MHLDNESLITTNDLRVEVEVEVSTTSYKHRRLGGNCYEVFSLSELLGCASTHHAH